MSAPRDIAPERVEIGPVLEGEETRWMMCVVDHGGIAGEGLSYAEFYDTREQAVDAAQWWEMPIRFVHEAGTITSIPAPLATSASGVPLTRIKR